MREILTPELWEFPLKDGLVLARPDVHGLFLLNPTAHFIWDALASGASLDAVAEQVAGHFGIPLDVAHRDVLAIVGHWTTELGAPETDIRLAPKTYVTVAPDESLSDPQYYCLHDTVFRVFLDSEAIRDEVTPRLTGLQTAPAEPDFTLRVLDTDGQLAVLCNEELVSIEDTIPAARTILLQEMARLASRGCDWLALLHAGAYGNTSRCVIFAAPSHSGKTTLAAVLLESGGTLFSDDSVGLERGSLTIPAMPFALAMREGSWPVLERSGRSLDSLPVHTRFGEKVRFLIPSYDPHASAKATSIVFSRWEPGTPTTINQVGPLTTLMHLKESGFWVRHDRESIQTFLDWIDGLPSYELSYSDVHEAAGFIQKLLTPA